MKEVLDFFQYLFEVNSWPPRWFCGQWSSFHGWLYIISDTVIALSFFIVPIILIRLTGIKKGIPFPKVFWLFGALFLLCGSTHLIDAVIFWWPAYRLSGLLRFLTAIMSLLTLFALFKYFPLALKLKTPGQLQKEIDERLKVEEKLKKAHKKLENTFHVLQQSQKHLVQSEKMASLGVLTAGIAHEINNPINFISSGTDSLENDFKDLLHILKKLKAVSQDGESLKERTEIIRELEEEYAFDELIQYIPQTIADIKEGVNRTTEIVKGLLLYSRSDISELQKADIHESIDASLVLLKDKLKYTIKVVKNYDLAIGEIECYPGQLSQVFTNFIDNAIDAINNKGTITITTTLKNKQIEISIHNTGKGIPDAILEKIFDPFFTTKEVGKGTGLGLSICQGIIDNHKGTIEVKNKKDKGTEFIIILPK